MAAHWTIAFLMAPIGLKEHLHTAHAPSRSHCNPLQNREQQLHSLVKLELGRRQAGGGRPSLGVLSARLPYKANETLSTPMFVVCDCWRRCRLCCAWPHGRLMLAGSLRETLQAAAGAHALVHRETNKQTDSQTDDATTNSICNREATTMAGTGITMLQQQQQPGPGRGRGRRALICVCVPHRVKLCSPAESIEIFFFSRVPPEVHLVT